MHFTFEVPIAAPREAVFDYLADPVHRPDWQRSIRTFELAPQGAPRVGVRWRESVRGGITFDMEISAYERPRLWAEKIRSRAFSGTVTLTFADEGAGTRLSVEVDVTSHGLWKLVDPIGAIGLRREMRRDLGRVASLLDA